MAKVEKYSRAQILMHWGTLALLIVSFVSHDAMKEAWRALVRNGDASGNLGAWVHIIVGVVILGLVIARIVFQFTRENPPAKRAGAGQMLVAKVVKWALYGVLLAVPVTGLLAWFLGIRDAGDIHETLFQVGLLLTALHVGGALAHQFFMRDTILARMKLR